MLKEKTTKYDVGVIVARFQVHELHSAHIDLIETVVRNHNKVIIYLGLSPIMGTRNNPLDFEARKQMLLERFPNINVLYIKDMPSDEDWSEALDTRISDMLNPNQTVVLYGGRDSFISRYHGRYPVLELEPTSYISGSELRKEISSKVKASADFRAGVIWSVNNRWPSVQTCVDAIIYNTNRKILLVRKHNETLYRFPGGFSQPDTDTFEMDMKREIREEVGVETGELKYEFSFRVPDWRFENEIDKIKTIVFSTPYVFGAPKVTDTSEIAEVRWVDTKDFPENHIVPEHRVIYRHYLTNMQ